MYEEKDYSVVITITLTTRVAFASFDRDRPITMMDAIDNAIGSMPVESWKELETGFGGEFVPEISFKVKEI